METGRERTTSFSEKHEIYLIGEQLRTEMHSSMLIRDRRYHLRNYRQCFAGNEIVDWLVRCKHCSSRSASISGMRILQKYGIFHHVCDDHKFKDDLLFYRFRRDDDTSADKDLTLFYTGIRIYHKMTKKKGLARDFIQGGQTYHNAFIGSKFTDWLTGQKEAVTREDAIYLGRQLLENNIIRHVTDDHHFRNSESLLYQFSIDFARRRILADVFKLSTETTQVRLSFSSTDSQEEHTLPRFVTNTEDRDYGYPGSLDQSGSWSSEHEHSNDNGEANAPKSVMLRQATADELESPDTPYVKQRMRIISDSVGYGVVLRGEGPTYVQTVDPTGPAALAGLKVRQYVYAVNGVNVLRKNHKDVGQTIMSNENVLDITVLTHKRDAINT
ncbi:DEP domain-containing mTOR-interacting protein-like [Mizuhopecten yessoensis]|uniref:DEP domain-containing mTOR-interacting protein n=1 Tax=Mizuhopecten yessoensis TaxID=6573 RepID=A0A210PNR7_MIZYE|nr:DEP domain-containing mTOR-interacting protein-like [Mizuhopecten yessoensis]XP_021378962.1 DEP domain-containing mTOR-interacting protein-like [Mizuhopecten yessoensis]OWF38113.1 DEP domain-containing mTOR-interacting protein [Mizuhopecten yessoensis]